MFSLKRQHLLALAFNVFAIGCISISFPAAISAQIQIWGASSGGGTNSIGSIFSLFDDGSDLENKYSFTFNNDGNTAQTPLLAASDGALYGTTLSGGTFNNGTIYRFTEADGFETLHHFNGTSGGANSQSGLIEISPGEMVGAASTGGQNGVGILYQYSLTTGFSVLHNFAASTEGANPIGQMYFDIGTNTLYGNCLNGGAQGLGTLFQFTISASIVSLHHFSSAAAGSNPRGGLTLGSDGKLYGTCQFGGANGQGNIFRFDIGSNVIEVVYNLNNATSDGRFPAGRLIESSPGIFLGTCSAGATLNAGSIFKVTSAGVYTRLRSLSNSDGSAPKSGLTAGGDSFFYGLTDFGGSGGGTFYRINESGTFTKLRNLSASADGTNGLTHPTLTGTNTLITPVSNGGVANDGTILKYTIGGTFSKLHNFSLSQSGQTPQSLLAVEGGFLGTTNIGGGFNTGALFFTELSGQTVKLADFEPSVEGQNPNGILCPTGDGHYIGTARFGGLFDSGTIFRTDLEGNVEILHHFDGGEFGLAPFGGVFKHSDGNYYGTTLLGGIFGEGIIYRITEDGSFTYLQSCFGFFDGGNPESTPTEGENGLIYFSTTSGGDFSAGTLVSYDLISETITAAHHFTGANDGSSPKGSLLTDAAGHIFGTTTLGGSGGGTIFRYSVGQGFSTLHGFSPASEGSNPAGGLSQDINGKIYGFCQNGGSGGFGSLFSYSDADGFELIASLDASIAPQPVGVPAFFYPECLDPSGCETSEPCNVARCNFGICEEAAINPVFSDVVVGFCNPMENGYNLTITLTLDASPGGSLSIGGQSFILDENVLQYTIIIETLIADGGNIDLDYAFEATGCTGATGIIGTAPEPCPPVFLTLILHTADLVIGSEGLFVGGNFQGWNPSQYPMSEIESELYEVTIPISAGEYEFNFFNGPSIFDGEYTIGACAVNGKRQLSVGEENLTLEYCWETCAAVCGLSAGGLFENIPLKIWPNPAPANSEIRFSGLENLQIETYQILDLQGRLVAQGYQNRSNLLQIDQLQPGLYLLQFTSNNGAVVAGSRLVVQ